MSDRITKKHVSRVFVRYCKLIEEFTGALPKWELEHIAHYGGYAITDETGSMYPLGHSRRSTKEMYDALTFACDTLIQIQTIRGDYDSKRSVPS